MKKSKGKKSKGKGRLDMGKMSNWEGKKQAPSSKNKGFGSC